MSLDERLKALLQTVKLMRARQLDRVRRGDARESQWDARWQQIAQARQQDTKNIRALARIAEIHERRLTHLEGGEQI